MDDGEPCSYSIGELAREFEISTRSIRFYESEGLIEPRRSGQTRIYCRQDRTRLKLILRGKRLGFSLAETKQLLDLYDVDRSSRTQLTALLQLVEPKKALLRQQLNDIRVTLKALTQLERQCQLALQQIRQNTNP